MKLCVYFSAKIAFVWGVQFVHVFLTYYLLML